MLPAKVNVDAPFFNNIWGEFFRVIGFSQNRNINIQQTPDFISALIALVLISILQFRGILTVTQPASDSLKKENRLLFTVMNLLSIAVHTLFFTMLVKIFIFPNYGTPDVLQNLHTNIALTVFIAFSVAGMIFGAQSVSKILMIAFAFVLMFKNIRLVNSALGVGGFAAILSSVCGFYLEFIQDSFSRKTLLLDLNFFLGRYENIELKAKDELKKLTGGEQK